VKLVKIALGALLALGACRGQPSEKQPIHLVPDMDWQLKFQPEEAAPLWADGRAMRPLVDGTVAQGHLVEDAGLATGMVGDQYLARAPITVDAKLLHRGQDRFNIYCSPCHDRTGGGQGVVVKRGYPPPINLASDRVLGMSDGQIFWTMTNGVRNMPSYRKQVPIQDRWAIVAWVRVLGRSQHGALADVPEDQKSKIDSVDVSGK
jgi:mono/diheme cytochrome c family protein